MPDLSITVERAEAVPFAASPTLAFKLRVANADPAETIHTVVLRCQIQIEVTRRRYTAADQERLRDLFGEPERWGQTLRNLLWTNTSAVIPQFTGATTVDLQVPCTFDFSVATTKYFNGLADGDIPVCLMFSGTVFYADPDGSAAGGADLLGQRNEIPPAAEGLERHDGRVLSQQRMAVPSRDVFEELHRFKVERGIPTWEQAFETMLASPKEETVRS